MTDWIVYAAGVSLLLGAAAWGTEAALRALGRPARGVWLAALAGSLVLPAYAAAGGPLPALLPFPAPFAEPAGLAATGALAVGAELEITAASAAGGNTAWFALAWAAASLGLVGLVLLLELRLRRERRGWLESAVDGVPVLVSRDVGPAVAGLVRGRIVLPAWALRLDARVVRAIVAHEAEHVRARDTRALLAGVLAVCALPWNPVLWWQYRRLGLAVELDCDARVLRALPDPRAYGLALLETARRRSRGSLLSAALLRPRSFLWRRLEMMDLAAGRRLTARALACAGIAALALVVAVCADSPAELEIEGVFELKPTASATVNLVPVLVPPILKIAEAKIVYLQRIGDVWIRRIDGARITANSVQIHGKPGLLIERGELRYIEEPEPHLLLLSGRMRYTRPDGSSVTASGDSVRLYP